MVEHAKGPPQLQPSEVVEAELHRFEGKTPAGRATFVQRSRYFLYSLTLRLYFLILILLLSRTVVTCTRTLLLLQISRAIRHFATAIMTHKRTKWWVTRTSASLFIISYYFAHSIRSFSIYVDFSVSTASGKCPIIFSAFYPRCSSLIAGKKNKIMKKNKIK